MARQHATPLLVDAQGTSAIPLVPLALGPGGHGLSEAAIQALVQAHPDCLPIAEIDPMFVGPVPICTELNTPAGPIDNFMVTPGGLPVLVECKLWRNPEARREVVGQILDYAKELARWSASDLQREASRRLGRSGNPLLDLVREAGHDIDEIAFNDALTVNLRRGRFLLIILGDGIREGVEAIAEYLQVHAGLHFTLGLVEMPIFAMADGQRIVTPRVLARTTMITRTVIALPDNMVVAADLEQSRETDPDVTAWSDERQHFWTEFLSGLVLDDPEQIVGKAPRLGYTTLTMPAPNMASWLTIYRDVARGEVGIFLSFTAGSIGEPIATAISSDPEALSELGGTARITTRRGLPCIGDSLRVGDLADPANRARAFDWLRARTNDFVNVMRPRVRALAADLAGDQN